MYKRWFITLDVVELSTLKQAREGGKYDQMIGLSTQNLLTFLYPQIHLHVHKGTEGQITKLKEKV